MFFAWQFQLLFSVHFLQNSNAKLHKIVWRHYSGEMENVYITAWQITGQYTPTFIRLGRVLWKIWQKSFWCVFSVHSVLTYLLTYRTTSGLQCSSVETSRGQEWSTNRGDSSAKCPVHQMSCSASCPMSNLRCLLVHGLSCYMPSDHHRHFHRRHFICSEQH